MTDQTFKRLDIEQTIASLTLKQKVQLLGGKDIFTFGDVLEAGIPSLRCSDGPNGTRGRRFFNGTPASCFPCGTGLAASFDVDLVKRVGEAIGDEARAKSAHIILGPTINIQRSPLGGRGFESYSESPLLSGMLASAYINGVQSKGVACSVKHFVCNEQELERFSQDSVVSQRALREVFLEPFRLAHKHSAPLSFMSSYNRINGVHASENRWLLNDVLREEWGWKGLIMSDWTGVYSVAESIQATLDVEMPGPPVMRGGLTVNRAIQSGKLTMEEVDDRVRNVLELVNHGIDSGIPFYGGETSIDTPELRDLLRQSAVEAVVLLKNSASLLPLSSSTKSIAVIGSNAKIAVPSGGGSAALASTYTVTPLEGITEAANERGISVDFAIGASAFRYLPVLDSIMTNPVDGKPGAQIEFFKTCPVSSWFEEEVGSALPQADFAVGTVSSLAFMADGVPYEELGATPHCRMSTIIKPDISGVWTFGLCTIGVACLYLNGKLLIRNVEDWELGGLMFNYASVEKRAEIELEAGKEYHLEVREYPSSKTRAGPFAVKAGIRLGGFPEPPAAEARAEAAALAAKSDIAIVVVGTNNDWESEGFDREDIALPGASDALVEAVLAANPNTIVVTQSGTPLAMPWIKDASAVLQAFFGGNELGNALADVLFGKVNPSGKLPLTFPVRLEDNPTFHNFGAGGTIVYEEGLNVGYRHYQKMGIKPLFPFGFGLSFTTFAFSDLSLSPVSPQGELTVSLKVTNTGERAGREVAQVYLSAPKESRPASPVKELKSFAKVSLEAGESTNVELKLEKEAFSWFDEGRGRWVASAGVHRVLIGNDSTDPLLEGEVVLEKEFTWIGL
ncbi:glycoside hydrolase family 3 protein, partial [Leucosporidium creatinivorum]